jgi:hypothetical protein
MSTKRFFTLFVILLMTTIIISVQPAVAKSAPGATQAGLYHSPWAAAHHPGDEGSRRWSGAVGFSDNDYPDIEPQVRHRQHRIVHYDECILVDQVAKPRRFGGCIE